MKPCRKCGVEKPLGAYSKFTRAPDGLQYWCKDCMKAHGKDYKPTWNVRNKDKVSAYARRAKLRSYGLSEDEFDAMILAQDGKCAICSLEVDLCVDHNHVTGSVRQLLCGNCNRGLGMFQDNPDLLLLAGLYLERHLTPATRS